MVVSAVYTCTTDQGPLLFTESIVCGLAPTTPGSNSLAISILILQSPMKKNKRWQYPMGGTTIDSFLECANDMRNRTNYLSCHHNIIIVFVQGENRERKPAS
jgi:hypothetical protein